MDEKEFKKHLRDLAHGHHHPAEHDGRRIPRAKAGEGSEASEGEARAEVEWLETRTF